jgi:hypothetical protein
MENEPAKLRKEYLRVVYHSNYGDRKHMIHRRDLMDQLNITGDEEESTYRYLHDKWLVKPVQIGTIVLTAHGIDEVEREMAETYEQKQRLVLEKIYELGENSISGVMIWDLEKALSPLTRDEISRILIDLEDNLRLIDSPTGESLKILPAGIKFLEKSGTEPAPTQGHTSYTIIVHGNNSGAITQGNENSQTVVQTTNPDFNEAIRALFEIVQSSEMSADDKEEIVVEVVALNKLANKDRTAETLERAKLRMNIIDGLLKAADLTTKAAPYLPAINAYFAG